MRLWVRLFILGLGCLVAVSVLHQHDLVHRRVMHIDQLADHMGVGRRRRCHF